MDEDLSDRQLQCLRLIAAAEERGAPLSERDLTSAMGVNSNSAASYWGPLVHKGFLVRREDRRSGKLVPTDKGWDRYHDAVGGGEHGSR